VKVSKAERGRVEAVGEVAQVLANAAVAAEGYFRLDLDAPRIAAASGPGQFVMVRCGDGLLPLLRRPISVASLDGRRLSLVVRAVGPGTEWMRNRQPGDRVDLLGPLGNRFSQPRGRTALLVGGGIGVPPMLSLAEGLAREGYGGAVTAFVGGRTAGDLVLVEELAAAGAEVITATEDGSAGVRGLITEPLAERLASGVGDAKLYGCGPEGMLASLARLAGEHDLPCEISLEAHMACGLGACLGCAHQTAAGGLVHVCSEGPVFDAELIYGGGER